MDTLESGLDEQGLSRFSYLSTLNLFCVGATYDGLIVGIEPDLTQGRSLICCGGSHAVRVRQGDPAAGRAPPPRCMLEPAKAKVLAEHAEHAEHGDREAILRAAAGQPFFHTSKLRDPRGLVEWAPDGVLGRQRSGHAT